MIGTGQQRTLSDDDGGTHNAGDNYVTWDIRADHGTHVNDDRRDNDDTRLFRRIRLICMNYTYVKFILSNNVGFIQPCR